ncbi:pectate lyase [Lizonia empirigonia]|nr:pectate lyase [Lizonia empirigonia]
MKVTLAALAIFLGSALAVPTATAFPKPASSTGLPAAKLIPAGTVFDGKMVRYSRSPDTCQDQTETDEAAAMFIAEDGATIKNVIPSKAQAEGIHCRGACTLENVWWEDVCEDAATFKQPAGKTSYVIGGGAKGAADKIFQFNGRGTVSIKNFYAEDYRKPRNIIIDGVTAKDGGVLCGINTNYGDTCKIVNSCQNNNKSCDSYKGVVKGSGSSTKLGSGPDGTYCTTQGFTSSCYVDSGVVLASELLQS